MPRTSRSRVIVLAAIIVLTAGGCTPSTHRSVARSGPSPSPSPSAATPATPALCNAAEPARRSTFPFNRDDRGRDALIQAGQHGSATDLAYTGGVADFYNIDVDTVADLITDRYLDPYDNQNEAPTNWEIFQFMCLHPTVEASGYVVSIDRNDYRTTLDDIGADYLTSELRTAALVFCADAETELDSSLECFWD